MGLTNIVVSMSLSSCTDSLVSSVLSHYRDLDCEGTDGNGPDSDDGKQVEADVDGEASDDEEEMDKEDEVNKEKETEKEKEEKEEKEGEGEVEGEGEEDRDSTFMQAIPFKNMDKMKQKNKRVAEDGQGGSPANK